MSFIPPHSTPARNRQAVLVRRPNGIPLPDDFAIREAALPAVPEGKFLVRNLYLSADPVQRGWAANPALTPLEAPMRALAVALVVESRTPEVKQGAVVYGFFGWQDYAVAGSADLLSCIEEPKAPISAYAGVLGMPGVTAWLALLDLAPPKAGDVVLVSTAAGAVGSVVGQIARRRGARTVGLTGSEAKVARCIERYGYDLALNYKTIDLAASLAEAAPAGFNIYFDNTGGGILDTAIRSMAPYGRIVQCGTAATPVWSPPPLGLRPEREILTRRIVWSGFYIFDHIARFPEAIAALTALLDEGALAHDEDVDQGFGILPEALVHLFAGENSGKKLIYIGEG
jgi:NADPH-dependent curcumin reductase CurA